MSTSDDSTRPISVAELLARNGTIGSPPVGGHRRRKRIGGLTVAELTGEIPVYQTGEMPVISRAEVDEVQAEPDTAADYETVGYSEATSYTDEPTITYVESGYADTTIVYSSESEPDAYATETYAAQTVETYAPVTYASEEYTAQSYPEPYTSESGVEHYVETQTFTDEPFTEQDFTEQGFTGEPVPAVPVEPEYSTEPALELAEEPVVRAAPAPLPVAPPKSRNPLPRRVRGLQRSHDPRPQRRKSEPPRSAEPVSTSGAEQMNYDPVDGAVNLAGLGGDKPDGVDELRTYLQSSSGTLFSGETVADDLARRVVDGPPEVPVRTNAAKAKPGKAPAKASLKNGAKNKPTKTAKAGGKGQPSAPTPHESRATALRHAVVAVLQSMLAVVFGGGLFIAFDQLWRWNNIVALVLSVLVILGLVVAVRVVRKTEDIASTLIAVAVGALVTLGPLALLQSS